MASRNGRIFLYKVGNKEVSKYYSLLAVYRVEELFLAFFVFIRNSSCNELYYPLYSIHQMKQGVTTNENT